jgi:hypothetical protein
MLLLAFTIGPKFAPHWSSTEIHFRPLPSIIANVHFPAVLNSIAFLVLSLVALRRISKSSGRLQGHIWAWSGIIVWSLLGLLLLHEYAVRQDYERSNAVEYNVAFGEELLSEPLYDGSTLYRRDPSPPGCDYLVPGLLAPRRRAMTRYLIVLLAHNAKSDGSRCVAYMDHGWGYVSKSDFPAKWAANNRARVALGLAPLPMP